MEDKEQLLNPHGSDETQDELRAQGFVPYFLTHTVQMKHKRTYNPVKQHKPS